MGGPIQSCNGKNINGGTDYCYWSWYCELSVFAQIKPGEEIEFFPCGSYSEEDQYTTYYEVPADPPPSAMETITESNCNSTLIQFCDPYANGQGYCTKTITESGVDYKWKIFTPTYMENQTCTDSSYQPTISRSFKFDGDYSYTRNVCMKIVAPSSDCMAVFDVSAEILATANPTPNPTPKPTPHPVSSPTPVPTQSSDASCDISVFNGTFCEGSNYEVSYSCLNITGCAAAQCNEWINYNYDGPYCYYDLTCCSANSGYTTPSPTPSPTTLNNDNDNNDASSSCDNIPTYKESICTSSLTCYDISNCPSASCTKKYSEAGTTNGCTYNVKDCCTNFTIPSSPPSGSPSGSSVICVATIICIVLILLAALMGFRQIWIRKYFPELFQKSEVSGGLQTANIHSPKSSVSLRTNNLQQNRKNWSKEKNERLRELMDGSRLYYGKENPDLGINNGSSIEDKTKETTVLRWTAPKYWREDLWYYFKNNNLIFSTMFVDPDNPLDSKIRMMLLFTQLCFLYFGSALSCAGQAGMLTFGTSSHTSCVNGVCDHNDDNIGVSANDIKTSNSTVNWIINLFVIAPAANYVLEMMKACLVCPCLQKKTTSQRQESCYKSLEGMGKYVGGTIFMQAFTYGVLGYSIMTRKCPKPCTGTLHFFTNFFFAAMYETIKIIFIQFAFVVEPWQISIAFGFVKYNINEWGYQQKLEEWREKFYPEEKKCEPKKLKKYCSIPYLFYIYTFDFTSSEYEGNLEKEVEMEEIGAGEEGGVSTVNPILNTVDGGDLLQDEHSAN